jgi:AraC-like DNA-binding protein
MDGGGTGTLTRRRNSGARVPKAPTQKLREMTGPEAPPPTADPVIRRKVLVMEPELMPLFRGVREPWEFVDGVAWDDLHEILRRSPPNTMVVVDPYAGTRPGERFPHVRELLRRFPSVPVMAAVRVRRELATDVQMLLDWGISEVLGVGPESTTRAVTRRLEEAHGRPLKRLMEAGLRTFLTSDAHQILMSAAETAVDGGQATELGDRMRVSGRTLTERLTRAELPPPRHVQAWMRLLLACMLLDDPGRTVYGAAYASGYHTERSLRRVITQLLGVDSTTLRRSGAFRTAIRAFNGVLREAADTALVARRANQGERR